MDLFLSMDIKTPKIELTPELKERILNSVQTILQTEYSGYKAELRNKHDRLNFACPYCGDSESGNKKRGNLYWSTLMYHCYNGGCSKPHTNVLTLLKDFNQSINNLTDLGLVLDYIKEHKVVQNTSDFLTFGAFETLNNIAIDKKELMKTMYAREIRPTDNIYSYLKGRLLHKRLEHFAWNQKRQQLLIFNLHKGKVLGMQIANMDFKYKGPKYITYTIERIYDKILKNTEPLDGIEGIEVVNTLSTYFGIFTVDFTRTYTIFEGPMDWLLYPKNSLAISGISKNSDMFDDNPNTRYFFDNDKIGKDMMTKKLKIGSKVFLWKKFMEDNNLDKARVNSKMIKDYNDIIMYCFRKKDLAYKKIEEYFSNSKFDTYYI